MKVIRDDQMGGLAMIPLFLQWGIRRCNVAGCSEKPNTIVVGAGPGRNITFGLCEAHFQQGNVPGGTDYELEFDDYDAFATRPTDGRH